MFKAYRNYIKCSTESLKDITVSPPVLPQLDYACATMCEAVSKKGLERDLLLSLVGYEVDPEFSTDVYMVVTPVKNNTNLKAVIVFRGTRISSTSNLKENYLIVQRKHKVSPLFVAAVKLTEDVIKKYGIGNIMSTGYSLGGAKAIFVTETLHIPSIVFNAAWSPFNIVPRTNNNKKCKHNTNSLPKIKAHIIIGDYISNSLLCHDDCTIEKIVYSKLVYVSHNLKNFLMMQKVKRNTNGNNKKNNKNI